jgi:hypothetical protein
MKNPISRRRVFPLEVKIENDEFRSGRNIIEDIYVTELGYVMISVFNEQRKVWVNYNCGGIEKILPKNIQIKEEGYPRSFGQ